MECERSPPAEAGISVQDTENRQRGTIAAARRMYECTFCKRGFTNAQALGGHMNIHRRDRAKAKQISPAPYCSSEDLEHFYNRNPNHQIFPVSDQFCFRRCFPASGSGLKLLNSDDQDVLSTSLSLRIGSSEKDENFGRIINKESIVVEGESELDLELRLGS